MKFADCGDACSECEPDVCSCCKISEYDKLNDLLTCMRKKFSGLFILLNYWNTGKIDYETFSWTNWFK